MFSVFDELVQNAVPVEFHKDKYAGTSRTVSDLNRVAVLVSAFQDGDRIVPVQFEIKEFNNQPNKLYVSVTLRDIKTKPRVVEDTLSVSSSKKSSIRSSSYSISQLKDIQSLCVKYSKPQGGIMEKHTCNEKENVV